MKKSLSFLLFASAFLGACVSVPPPTTYAPIKKLSEVPMMNDSCGHDGYRFEFLHEEHIFSEKYPHPMDIDIRYNSLDKIRLANLSCRERLSKLQRLVGHSLITMKSSVFDEVANAYEQEIKTGKIKGAAEDYFAFDEEAVAYYRGIAKEVNLSEQKDIEEQTPEEVSIYIEKLLFAFHEKGLGSAEARPRSAPNTKALSREMAMHAVVAYCHVIIDVGVDGVPHNVVPKCNYEPYEEAAKSAVLAATFQPRLENGVPTIRRHVIYPFDLRIE